MTARGRWLDLGRLAPQALHATYAGVAQAMREESAPVLIWARAAQAHLSLGASQSAVAELDLAACDDAGLELMARPLGGGTVLIDEAQYGVFVVLPQHRLTGGHQGLFTVCLAVLAEVLREFGIAARPVGATDVWVGTRKIVGSGAASIGHAFVFGASFLIDFDAGLFARVVRCPSEDFRAWLREALDEGMTSWSAHTVPPPEAVLAASVRRGFEKALDCVMEESHLSDSESRAIEEAGADLAEDLSEVLTDKGGRRLVANGVKVNHRTYLLQDGYPDAIGDADRSGTGQEGPWLRLLLRDGRIARVDCADPTIATGLQACIGAVPEVAVVAQYLAQAFMRPGVAVDTGERLVEHWARRIDRLTANVRRLSNG